MSAIRVAAVVSTLLLSGLRSQDEIWRLWPSDDGISYPVALGDLDGDGYSDVAIGVSIGHYIISRPPKAVRVYSGRDGSQLYEHIFVPTGAGALQNVVPAGDIDGDGFPEYLVCFLSGNSGFPNRVEVWSPHLDRMLWGVTGPSNGGFGISRIGNIDLNDDGFGDVLVAAPSPSYGFVSAYDHTGALLYTINLLSHGWQMNRFYPLYGNGLGAIGDIDGDGGDDFGVGVVDAQYRGAVALYSGRTGALIRVDHDPQPFDQIGVQVAGMGDVDQDGVPDYVTSNTYPSLRGGLVIVFSGATGQVIREWVDPVSYQAETMAAGMDLDLDGVPDVFVGSMVYYNAYEQGTAWTGRIEALSTRNSEMLWDERNMYVPGAGNSGDMSLGQAVASLGVQPGNPYPVVLVWDEWPKFLPAYGVLSVRYRVRAIRANLPGTTVTGTGCSSNGVVPMIAVRQVAGRARVTLGSAAPGVLAFLAVSLSATASVNGLALPIALDGYGLLGCDLRVAPDLVLGATSGTSGLDKGVIEISSPFTVAATGLDLAAQWIVFDPPTAAYGATPRHTFHLR